MSKEKNKTKQLIIIVSIILILIVAGVGIVFFKGNNIKLSPKKYNANLNANGDLYLSSNEEVKLNLFEKYKADSFNVKDESVATISDDGTIKGIKSGQTTVDRIVNGKKAGSFEVYVDYRDIQINAVESNDLDIDQINENNYHAYTKEKNQKYTFTVTASKNALINIYKFGIVNPVASGTEKIKYTSDGGDDNSMYTINVSENNFSKYYFLIVGNVTSDMLYESSLTSAREKQQGVEENNTNNEGQFSGDPGIAIEEPQYTTNIIKKITDEKDNESNVSYISGSWTNRSVVLKYNLVNGNLEGQDYFAYYIENDSPQCKKIDNCGKWIKGNSIKITESGINKIKFGILDANNNVKKEEESISVNIDKDIPKVKVENPSEKNTVFGDYEIKISAESLSPVKYYEVDYNTTGVQIKKYTPSENNNYSLKIQNQTEDKDILIKACNEADNCSEVVKTKLRKVEKIKVDANIYDLQKKSVTKKVYEFNQWINNGVQVKAQLNNSKYNVYYSICNEKSVNNCKDKWIDSDNVLIDNNGQTFVKFGVLDQSKKVITQTSYYKVLIDTVKPSITNINNPYGTKNPNKIGNVNISAQDKESGIAKYNYKLENDKNYKTVESANSILSLKYDDISTAKNTKLIVNVCDKAGNCTSDYTSDIYPSSNSIAVDYKLQDPKTKKMITQAYKPNDWNNKFVEISATTNISKDKGELYYYLEKDSASKLCNKKDCRGQWIKSSVRYAQASGLTKIKFAVRDKNGNTIAQYPKTGYLEVKIDVNAPTVPKVFGYQWKNNDSKYRPKSNTGLSGYTFGNWSKNKIFTIARGSIDKDSGIDHYEYTTTGKTTNVKNHKGNIRNIETEGVSTIKYRACDKAGNCSNYSNVYTTKVNYSKPKIPTVKLYLWKNSNTRPTSSKVLKEYKVGKWENLNIYTEATSTDKISGIDHYEYTTTGKTTNVKNYKGNGRNIEANGLSTIKYRACNKSGICSDYTKEYKIYVDNIAPKCNPTSSKNGSKITIKPNCTDKESGVETVYAYVNKGSATWKGKQGVWKKIAGNFIVEAYGKSTIKFMAKDAAGNSSKEKSIIVNNPRTVVKKTNYNNNNYKNNYYNNSNNSSSVSKNKSNKTSKTKRTTKTKSNTKHVQITTDVVCKWEENTDTHFGEIATYEYGKYSKYAQGYTRHWVRVCSRCTFYNGVVKSCTNDSYDSYRTRRGS